MELPNFIHGHKTVYFIVINLHAQTKQASKVGVLNDVTFEESDLVNSTGNARLVRNVFEMTISNQANRIVQLATMTDDALSNIDTADIPSLDDLKGL